ncbi:MAG TPA: hypothetical protein VMT37_03705 [Solirubrobacterales bacterium]|nr:hypothetical protein [Solirubrobacterales bacterium]
MRRLMIRYKVKPGLAEENEALVRAVYEELAQAQPPAMKYSTHRLEDGRSFVHLHESGPGAPEMGEFAAFREFQREVRDRCEEPPVVTELTGLTEIGSYAAAS